MDHPKRILKEINDIKEDPEAHIDIKFAENLGNSKKQNNACYFYYWAPTKRLY